MDVTDLKINDKEYLPTGFQATNLGRAIGIIEKMKKENATIFLTFTSNMVASGLRGVFAQMCKKKLVDVIITAGGSLDHDLIRSNKKYLIGDFTMDDKELHQKGINRIGNILVPNECYVYLEKFMQPVYEELYQSEKIVSPSQIARKIGEKTREDSFLYWCTKNKIPVFCPGITDSAIGLQTYFFKQKRKDFGIDVTKDMNELAQLAMNANKTGGIILGGGISKHHAIGVNLLRDGFDYAVYVTTSSPWDGSLSGARTNEGISWGKIKEKANHVTVDCDASIAVPLIMEKFLK
ncbi:putative deoxyhypusine synthase [Candidatus Bilamarchaeum dharawalense]|uniref:Putative deoxyhypusine synthase n=1 Tax=Candidatus Bilamarchaeum dharawalense TaxID=2885759 RepID=A0A5E4LL19_9ARCH|nr:putative deoxyhypusine synthase [Candidatus Bilamarchaeum dharawalense]